MEKLYAVINTKTNKIGRHRSKKRLGVFTSKKLAETHARRYVWPDESYTIVKYAAEEVPQ